MRKKYHDLTSRLVYHLQRRQVQFIVNNIQQSHAMKLGEGGEAFFVFETSDEIPESLQTSPIVSPAYSPQVVEHDLISASNLQEPDFLDLTADGNNIRSVHSISYARPIILEDRRAQSDFGIFNSSPP